MSELLTARTRLRPWRESDRAAMAAMLSDPEVMHDHPAPLTRAESDAKLDRYAQTYVDRSYGRMVLETLDGAFLGYVGIMPINEFQAASGLTEGGEIGWRMVRRAWGRGYATEAARAVLEDGFSRLGFDRIWAFTIPRNERSQAVMQRLGMIRRAAHDYSYEEKGQTIDIITFSVDQP